jgi:DNA-binding GntR family transcriptional regulator
MREHGGRYPVELDFHKTIIELAANSELSSHISIVHNRLRILRVQSGYQTERALAAYFEHVAILDAMIRRDSEAAQAHMRAHLRESRISVASVSPRENATQHDGH